MSGIWVSRGSTAIAQLLRRRLLVKFLAIVGMSLPAAVSAEELPDFDVGAAGNMAPRGMWGNSEIVWVTDHLDSTLHAYAMADGSRLPSGDIETRTGDPRRGARYPTDVWSDGQVAWVTDNEFDRIYAYRLSDGGRVPDRDLSLSAANGQATGLWGDGEPLWVTDKSDGSVYAHGLSDGSRLPAWDLELAAPDGGTLALAWELRSDGRVLWVPDYGRAMLYANNLASQAPATALTAGWQDVPPAVDGETGFWFELRFSGEASLGFRTLRDEVFGVTGATVTRARQVTSGSNPRWRIGVRPASDADMVLVLPVTTDCVTAGAPCTAGGKPLSNQLQATVGGLRSVSISWGEQCGRGNARGRCARAHRGYRRHTDRGSGGDGINAVRDTARDGDLRGGCRHGAAERGHEGRRGLGDGACGEANLGRILGGYAVWPYSWLVYKGPVQI